MEPKKSKISRLSSKKAAFVLIIALVILMLIGGTLYLLTKNNNVNDSTQQAEELVSQAPKPTAVQPLNSPNAGQPVGKELEEQIATATKQAEELASKVAKLPKPTNNDEKVAYYKKKLELGQLYLKAMMHKQVIETLGEVEYINATDYSLARATMARAAVALGMDAVAINYYQVAIDVLKSYPTEYQNTDKINEYSAAIIVIEDRI